MPKKIKKIKMGCENPTSKEDADLIMASGSISALHITTLPPPEIQNEGLDNFPFELKYALRGKLLNQCGINSKFNEITSLFKQIISKLKSKK